MAELMPLGVFLATVRDGDEHGWEAEVDLLVHDHAERLLGLQHIPVLDDRDPPYDPTHGQIDRDIQEAVDAWGPESLGQRVAVENTLQERRGRGGVVLGVDPTAAVSDAN